MQGLDLVHSQVGPQPLPGAPNYISWLATASAEDIRAERGVPAGAQNDVESAGFDILGQDMASLTGAGLRYCVNLRVTPLTIAFDAGEIRGDSGCNSFDASYTYDPATGALAVDSLTSTERACGADRGDLEAALFDALRAASAASIDAERRLTLAGPGGTIVLVQHATFEPG